MSLRAKDDDAFQNRVALMFFIIGIGYVALSSFAFTFWIDNPLVAPLLVIAAGVSSMFRDAFVKFGLWLALGFLLWGLYYFPAHNVMILGGAAIVGVFALGFSAAITFENANEEIRQLGRRHK